MHAPKLPQAPLGVAPLGDRHLARDAAVEHCRVTGSLGGASDLNPWAINRGTQKNHSVLQRRGAACPTTGTTARPRLRGRVWLVDVASAGRMAAHRPPRDTHRDPSPSPITPRTRDRPGEPQHPAGLPLPASSRGTGATHRATTQRAWTKSSGSPRGAETRSQDAAAPPRPSWLLPHRPAGKLDAAVFSCSSQASTSTGIQRLSPMVERSKRSLHTEK